MKIKSDLLSLSSFETVEVSCIDLADERYRITTGFPGESLRRSVSTVGLIHPPVLQKNACLHIVVAGFNRIRVAAGTESAGIKCFVLPEETPALECLLFAIADNLYARPLNILEQAMAVHKLLAFMPDRSRLCSLLSDIGLDISPSLITKYERLIRLPGQIRSAVATGVMTLTSALYLWEMTAEIKKGGDGSDLSAVSRVCALFERLRPGTNRQRQILLFLKEIAAQKEIPVSAVFDLPDVLEVLNRQETDRKAMLSALLSVLRKLRFPVLCTMEENFKACLSRLDLPQDVRMIFPEGFEDTRYRLIMDVSSPADFQKHAALMQRLASHPAVSEIFRREFPD